MDYRRVAHYLYLDLGGGGLARVQNNPQSPGRNAKVSEGVSLTVAARKKKGESGAMTCTYSRCPAPENLITLDEQRRAVRLQNGPMHLECWQNMRAGVDEMIRRAIADGTHAAADHKEVCSACREFAVIYAGSAQSKDRYCFPCYLKMGGMENASDQELRSWQLHNPLPDRPDFPRACSEQLNRRAERRARLTQFSQAGR